MILEKHKEKLQYQKFLEMDEDEGENIKNGNDITKIDKAETKLSDVTPDDETYSLISEWENVSNDTCQFTLLIGNLEDITILHSIIRFVLHYIMLSHKYYVFFRECNVILILVCK